MIDSKTTTQTDQHSSVSQAPRLAPIEHPESLKLKGVYNFFEQKMGKVITPVKVIQARLPESIELIQQIAALDQKLSIPASLNILIKSYVATLNGCAFCIDIAAASARAQGIDIARYEHLLDYQESPNFTEAEKATLNYARQATQNIHIEDSTFEALQQHYSERKIIEIIWLNATENYYNLINAPLNIGSDELVFPA